MNTSHTHRHPHTKGPAGHASAEEPAADVAPEAVAAAHLLDQALGHLYSASLRAAADLRIADHLDAGPRTTADLARRTDTDEVSLRRLLRYLASREVFREDENGAFHLTPAARYLRTGTPGSLHAAVVMLTEEMFLRPESALQETVRTGEPAFPKVFGAPFFSYLNDHAAARELFDVGMAAFSDPVNGRVADTYPFPERGVVVDVGGGRGGLLRDVLLRHPGLTGVLCDQEQALREHLLDVPELAGRWRAVPGDFFTAVPEGGDFYLLKHVLPDWGDEDCVRILGSCRRAMAPGGRVLIVDSVLRPGNEPHPGKGLDVAMMMLQEGRAREPGDLDALLAGAGLRRTRTLRTPAFPSIVEAVAKAGNDG